MFDAGHKKFFRLAKNFNFHRIDCCCSKKLKVIKMKEKRPTTKRNKKHKANKPSKARMEKAMDTVFHRVTSFKFKETISSNSILCPIHIYGVLLRRKFEWKFQTWNRFVFKRDLCQVSIAWDVWDIQTYRIFCFCFWLVNVFIVASNRLLIRSVCWWVALDEDFLFGLKMLDFLI